MWDYIKFWVFCAPVMVAWVIIAAPGNWIITILDEHTPFWKLELNYQLLDFIALSLGIVVWLSVAYGVFRWGFGWVVT